MKVICIGDSLTNGAIGYTYRSFLNEKYITVNKGIDGDTTEGVLFRLKRCLENEEYDDISTYILFVGINDCLFLNENKFLFENVYEKILKLLKRKNKRVVVIGLPYVEFVYNTNELVVHRNKVIEELSGKYDFYYIDIYSKQEILKSEGYDITIDGVHFSELSAKALADEVNKVLAELG